MKRTTLSVLTTGATSRLKAGRLRLQRRLGLRPSLPETVFLSVNSSCNLRCRMCDLGQRVQDSSFYQNLRGESATELPTETLLALVDQVSGRSWRPLMHVMSTEPLLHDGLREFVRYARARKVPTAITTNGLLLERHAEALVSSGVGALHVSLDGPPAVHDAVRGFPGSFDRAVAGLQAVASYRPRDIRVRVNYTISDANYSHLTAFLEALEGVPVDSVTFSHLNFVTEQMAAEHNAILSKLCPATPTTVSTVSVESIDIDTLYAQVQAVEEGEWPFDCGFIPRLLTRERLEMFYRDPSCFVDPAVCLVPWRSMQVLANGDVVPLTRCLHMVLGNIHDKSLRSVWYGDDYRRFRAELARRGTFPVCSRCCGIM